MLIESNRIHQKHRMRVVGRGDNKSVEVVGFFLEHLPIVVVGPGAGKTLKDFA